MKTATKIFGGILTIAALTLQTPAAQQAVGGLMSAHPNVSAAIGFAAALLALFHNPNQPQSN